MKDDTSTQTPDGTSPNEFERDKPGNGDRSRAEAAIEDLRRRGGVFVNAVRATRMPMVLTDPNLPGNPIVFANQAFLGLSGYSMEEVLGQEPHFMNGPGTDPKDAARFEEALRADQDDIIETVQYRKNGTRFVATVLVSAYKDDTGRTLNHFMSWLDVTRRVEAEDEVAELKHVQAALRDSEERYRTLFESMDEGYLLGEVLLDEKNRAIDILFLAANPAAVRLAGRDFTGQRMREIDPNYDDYWYEAYAGVALTGEPVRAEQYAEPHGRWFDFQLSRVGLSESRLVASVFQDITERKLADNALRASEERLRNVLEGMDEAFGLMDRDLRIITQNKSALAIDGRSLHELQGRLHSEAYPNTDPQLVELYERALREGKPVSLEHCYGWDEGRASWLEMRAYPVPDGLAVFWRDISERKAAEQKLRESEERYRKLFESMDEAYAVVDVLKDDAGNWCDFRFIEVNPAFLHHTNMPPPVGKTATELLGTPNPRWTELYGEALDTGKALRVEEHEATLGLTFDLNIFTLDRERNRVAVLFTNISERKQGEEALRRSEQHAQTLLAELQHRVRNTLAVVRSIARRTAERSTDVEEMIAHFEGRLNAFSRVQSAITRSPETGVELNAIVEDELLAVAAREGKQLTIKGPDVHFKSRAAETLSLAIHELATNAVKYGALSVESGRIRVQWKRVTDGDPEYLDFEWVESGLPVEPSPGREGFGHEMLKRSLAYDVGAKTEIQFKRDGLRFVMHLPLTANVLAEGIPE